MEEQDSKEDILQMAVRELRLRLALGELHAAEELFARVCRVK